MNHRLLWLGLGLTAWLATTPANAEVVTDGTMGQALTLSGPDYAITPDLGRQVGGNSFYSFLDFSLRQGESATFSGPGSIANFIVRVTGGHESMIDGLLRSTVPGADLYLLNPAGVIFGPHASLDLQGSFYVSTADALTLGEEGIFDAVAPEASVLTADPPTSFGFLGEAPASITVAGASLAVPAGETISIVGGRIEMTNGSSLTADEVTISGTEIVVGEDSSINSATVVVSSENEPWGDEETGSDDASLPAEETTLDDDTPQLTDAGTVDGSEAGEAEAGGESQGEPWLVEEEFSDWEGGEVTAEDASAGNNGEAGEYALTDPIPEEDPAMPGDSTDQPVEPILTGASLFTGVTLPIGPPRVIEITKIIEYRTELHIEIPLLDSPSPTWSSTGCSGMMVRAPSPDPSTASATASDQAGGQITVTPGSGEATVSSASANSSPAAGGLTPGTALHLHETEPALTATVVKGAPKLTSDGTVRERGFYTKDSTATADRANTGYDSRIQLGVNAQVSDQETGALVLESGVPTVPASTPGSQATLVLPSASLLPLDPKPLRHDPFPLLVGPVSNPIATIDLQAAMYTRQPPPLPLPEALPLAPLPPELGLTADAPVAFGF